MPTNARLTPEQFHDLFHPRTFRQWACVLLPPWFTVFPAMSLNGFFFGFLAVLPLPVWVGISVVLGLIFWTTYFPVRRYWYAGLLPGLIAGPCSLVITYWYTLTRQELYRAECALVWLLSMAPAMLIYYGSLRFLVLRSGSSRPAEGARSEFDWPHDDRVHDVTDLLADEPPGRDEFRAIGAPSVSSRMTPRAWVLSGVVVLLLFVALVAVAFHQGGAGHRRGARQEPDVSAQPGTAPVRAAVSIHSAIGDLRSDDVVRRRQAAQTLAESGPVGRSIPEDERRELNAALAECLDDDDLAVRRAATRALGLWSAPGETRVLIECLENADALTRFEAMEALAGIGDGEAAAAIAARLAVGQDRDRAAAALRQMGPVAERAALACLDHDDVWVRIEACRTLGAVGGDGSLAALEAACSDSNGLVAGEARKAVAAVRARRSARPFRE